MGKLFEACYDAHTFDVRSMENGEQRVRVTASDGSAYIRTEAAAEGAWQNAHHHKGVLETYIIQKGWIAVADAPNHRWRIRLFRAGQVFTSEQGVDHNVYMPADAVIHTVQHGEVVANPQKGNGKDWYAAASAFDRWSKALSLEDIAEETGDFTIVKKNVV